MQMDSITHVGLDVHARTIAVALADWGDRSKVRSYGTIDSDAAAVGKLISKLQKSGRKLVFWYEAGPCGYGLHRQITAAGHACFVVAPSRIPRKPGDRIKTDRRDAINLARLGRSGDLTAVWVPDDHHEAVRDLIRCRRDAKRSQRASRQKISSFLLRHGRHYGQGKAWTKTHRRWLDRQAFDQPVLEMVYREYLHEVDRQTERVAALDREIEQVVKAWSLWPLVQALTAMRGVKRLTAGSTVAEIGDLSRFDSPKQLMNYLGLTPGEASSGETTKRLPITKTGNRELRRLLIEAAWSYRMKARVSVAIRARSQDVPEPVRQIAWQAQKRLCDRYRRLMARGKPSVVVCAAIARELCGFMWAIAKQVRELGLIEARGAPLATL